MQIVKKLFFPSLILVPLATAHAGPLAGGRDAGPEGGGDPVSRSRTASATADSDWSDLAALADRVGGLLAQRYVFDPGIKLRFEATSAVELTPQNAELYLTLALFNNGLTRVPLAEPGSYLIARHRDARDWAIPIVTQETALPETWDLVTLMMKLEHPESASSIARTLRNFVPAQARVVANEASGTILVTDAAANLKKAAALIRLGDVAGAAYRGKLGADACGCPDGKN